MTPGKAIAILLTEAKVPEYLDGLTWDFEGTTDSDDRAWPADTP